MRLIEIKVTLLDTHPPVWRKLLLLPEFPLDEFHRIIQAAMGWQNAHLHRFVTRGKRYSDPRFQLEDGSSDEREVRVSDVLTTSGDRVRYEYDFGDSWQHELLCERFVESDLRTPYAICIDGARACPPEDCGGIPGYEDLLSIRFNHRFKPNAFSLEEANSRLSSLRRRRS